MQAVVEILSKYVNYISQLLAMLVIMIGIFKALITFLKDTLTKKSSKESIKESRQELGHSFSLGLGFLIGASILQTVIAPTWDDIAKLSAIIVIRTALNYFLTKESN